MDFMKEQRAAAQGQCLGGGLTPTAFTVRDRLTRVIEESEARADAARKALALLDRNPDFEELHNLIAYMV